MLREVINRGGSVGSESGNGKCDDDSEENVLLMVGVTVSERDWQFEGNARVSFVESVILGWV